MSKDCKIENMTVDGTIHGNVIEVENYNGSKSLIAGEFRGINIQSIFCSDCGAELDLGGYNDVDKVVKEHINEQA